MASQLVGGCASHGSIAGGVRAPPRRDRPGAVHRRLAFGGHLCVGRLLGQRFGPFRAIQSGLHARIHCTAHPEADFLAYQSCGAYMATGRAHGRGAASTAHDRTAPDHTPPGPTTQHPTGPDGTRGPLAT